MSNTNFSQLFREIYGDQLETLIPHSTSLWRTLDFDSSNNSYYRPVILGLENGVSFASEEQSNSRLYRDPVRRWKKFHR